MNAAFFHKTYIFILSVLLLASFSADVQAQDKDDLIIEPPLTWSINSIQIVWSVGQTANKVQQTKYIYSVDQVNSETAAKEKTKENSTNRGVSSAGEGRVDVSAKLEPNPLTLFGLLGSKVNASAYVEGGFNYNQSNRTTNTSQWSESEKNVVSTALQSAFEQNVQQTISDQRLVFTVDFVNHTKLRLHFSPDSANTIPVYCGSTHIGDAHLISENATIAVNKEKPIPIRFAMEIDDTGKQILLNHRPKIDIDGSQLLIQSESVKDAIQESIVGEECFTVAILSGDQVLEWKIRWFEDEDKAVKLQDALEAINKKMRRKQNNGRLTIFEIKDNHLVSVCNTPFTNDNKSKWITELNVIENNDSQIVTDPDSYLLKAPQLGDRFVFQLVKLEVRRLLEEAQTGDAQAQFKLAQKYYYGEGVPVDMEKAMLWINKAVEQQYSPAIKFLEDVNSGKYAGERKVYTVNGVEFAFRWCPAGTFTMGSPESEEGRKDDEKQLKVKLTKGFWMMETEVTIGMFKAFVNGTGYESKGDTPYGGTESSWEQNSKYSWRNPGSSQDDNHPVTCVSWNDAVAFCKWLSKKTGQKITLPTESQWEYACRAGTTGAYAGYLDEMVWYWDNSGFKTHPVGTKKPNAWGLYDMHGNVWEWCQDWYAQGYRNGSVTDPTGPWFGSIRVVRGGSWGDSAEYCRSACRYSDSPDDRDDYLGFRCVKGQ